MPRSTHSKEIVRDLAKSAWAIRSVIRQVQSGYFLRAHGSLGQVIEMLTSVQDRLTRPGS